MLTPHQRRALVSWVMSLSISVIAIQLILDHQKVRKERGFYYEQETIRQQSTEEPYFEFGY